jgi:SNF2 family DNA or RNA helicase
MPSLFDSHEEFSEWFSKDIENAAGGSGDRTLKPEQLRRLHMILKPFMLRRVKKHVQKELGDKVGSSCFYHFTLPVCGSVQRYSEYGLDTEGW